MSHANFYVMFFEQYTVLVDTDEGKSVTNDIEYVVKKVCPSGNIRLFYRDSQGLYDEIYHDGNGKFLTFKQRGYTDLFDLYLDLAPIPDPPNPYLLIQSKIAVYKDRK